MNIQRVTRNKIFVQITVSRSVK